MANEKILQRKETDERVKGREIRKYRTQMQNSCIRQIVH